MAAPPSAFPQDLPPRNQSFKDRHCPGMRNCWSFSLSSFSLKTSDKIVLARRICMLTVLGLRTALSILEVIINAIRLRIAWLVISIVLGILGFFFIAWCLSTIGNAVGTRRVMGIRVGRLHFDIFLAAMALIHVGLFISAFFSLAGGSWGWLAMWLLIWGAAWIAGWAPEDQQQQSAV